MSAKKDGGSVEAELLKLKEQVGLLEDLCDEGFSEEAVRALAKGIRKHIDRIAELLDAK
jgi:hypothetical protein